MNEDAADLFLELVRRLDEPQWARLEDDQQVAEATYGSPDIGALQESLRDAGVLAEGERLLERARELVPGEGAEQRLRRYSMAGLAASALYAEDILAAAEFAALYGPFARVIPLRILRPDRADLELPAGLDQRFIARLATLTEPDWQQVADLSELREYAVGSAAIDDAVQRGIEAAHDWTPVHERLKEWWQTVGPFAGSASLWQMIGRRLGKGDYFAAGAYATRMADREGIVWGSAQQALLAVSASESLADATFAILYLPFGGLVPFESLFARGMAQDA